ncbi:hypothetical protein LWI28_020467 [Acer negundo]|uniref:Uncharacterized protein n=1 Tax=Acer negundo TaxID=4023 RepID=A0AAD5NW96_ACENE|nr:hypothetical protein LWI28_020467 [Acer negundo]
MSETAYFASRNRTLIDSDHVAFGYCYASYSWLLGRQLKNYSFEFRLSEKSPNCRLKSCGVCPIYFQDPDTDDSDEAGTSGSGFCGEEMEPHPKENENLQTEAGARSHPYKRMEWISGVVATLGRANPLQTMVDLRRARQGRFGMPDARYQ